MTETSKMLDVPYGTLNRVEKPVVSKRADIDVDASARKVISDMSETIYTPNALNNTGPYKAICIRTEEGGEPGSWTDWFTDRLGSDKTSDEQVKLVSKLLVKSEF